jgi:predicted lipoprotein with Yx(FWY)xxD motif
MVLVATSGVATALMLTACAGTGTHTVLNTADGQQAAAQQGSVANGGYGTADSGSTAGASSGYGSSSASKSSAGILTSAIKTRVGNGVGTIVTDGKGWTLYRFDKDTGSPSKSNCNGACATTWPPALTDGGTPTLSGVKSGLVGKVRRADGTWQLTLAGWPMYRYSKDQKAGQWKGIGVGGTWWAVSPSGKRVQKCKPSMGNGNNGGYNNGRYNNGNRNRGGGNNTNVNVNVNVNINVVNNVKIVNVNQNNINLGQIVVGGKGKGRAMYRYDRDSMRKSNYSGKTWSPVIVDQTPQIVGVAQNLIGTILRSDGTKQLTLAGWPMYFFSGDVKSGDVKGEGMGGTWWAVRSDGSRAKA